MLCWEVADEHHDLPNKLHLAVVAEKLRMLGNLLTNREVCLNLRNNMGQTALDLAMANIREGFFYGRV